MAVPQSPTRIYEACFVEMGKTLRTAQFYPLTHPAFTRSLERSYLYLSQLLKRAGAFEATVSKTQISVHDRQITGNTKVLGFLAGELFRRRIKQLHFEQNAELKDYHALFYTLAQEAGDVQRQGGPEKLLAKQGATNIWANAMRFEATQISESAPEEHAPEPEEEEETIDEILDEAPAQHRELHEHLQKLTSVRKFGPFKEHLAEIVTYVRGQTEVGDDAAAALALQVFCRLAHHYGPDQKLYRLLVPAIRGVATAAVVELELNRLSRALGSSWEQHGRALHLVGPTVIPFVLKALTDSESRKERTRLIKTLHMFGDDLKKPVLKLLGDSRWYVVRNAIDLLADTGDPRLFQVLEEFMWHDHPKVRMAAREAARKLGGDEPLESLLVATERDEESDRRHAVSQLTFFPAQAVLPKLLELIDKAPAPVAEEALRVLSELDPPDMVPYLEKTLAERRGLFGKRKREVLRRTAAELVCLRLPETWELLKAYASDSDPEIRKWVARGVEWMQETRKRHELIA